MQLENESSNYYHKRLTENNFINATESINHARHKNNQANQSLATLRNDTQKENFAN